MFNPDCTVNPIILFQITTRTTPISACYVTNGFLFHGIIRHRNKKSLKKLDHSIKIQLTA
jgi:hypothetical protein